MPAGLKTRLADLELAAQAAEGPGRRPRRHGGGAEPGLRDPVPDPRRGAPRASAARLLAALEDVEDEPVEGYRDRVTEKMRSMLGRIQEFLVGIGKSMSPSIARVKR